MLPACVEPNVKLGVESLLGSDGLLRMNVSRATLPVPSTFTSSVLVPLSVPFDTVSVAMYSPADA